MRKAILGVASALALASPAVAADLPVPRYSEVPSYEPEVRSYGYRTAPPVIVEEPAFIVAPPPVVVDEYPVYAAPRVYAAGLLCMRTPIRFGVMDGAIDVTTAAVGDELFTGRALPLPMSALGQKQTCAAQKVMSALPPKADMCGAIRDVR